MEKNKPQLMIQLEGSIMPQAKFLKDLYYMALSRYGLAKKYAKGAVVLDIGCGAGYGPQILAKAGAKKVYGVDSSSESIDYCQRKYQAKNLVFSHGDATNLVFPDNHFDLIVALEMIEHVKNYNQALKEFHRVLKPNGKLIISTPNKEIYSPGTKRPFYPFHYYEFTLKELQKMLSIFKKVEIKGQFIKGRKMLLYSRYNPKRLIRIFYANLPFFLKRTITRSYLLIYSWIYASGLYQPPKIKLTDVYFSDNLKDSRIFVAVCEGKNEI